MFLNNRDIVFRSFLCYAVYKADAGSIFDGCRHIKEIVLPEGIVDIGSPETVYGVCLAYLTSLETIRIDPANPAYAVRNGVLFSKDGKRLIFCPPKAGLTEYTIPDSVVSIERDAFSGFEHIEKIILHDRLSELGERCFSRCSGLRSIIIPGSVKRIPDLAFMDCGALETVELRDGLGYIGAYAFFGCEGLSVVTIPDSVRGIDDVAFGYCHSGKTVQQRVRNFTIVCSDSCTAAKRYAEKNGFDLEIVN